MAKTKDTIDYRQFLDSKSLELLHNTGVYSISHKSKPEAIYIGSAATTGLILRPGFKKRLPYHIENLRKNRHQSKFLQNTVNKHGFEGLEIRILEVCSPELCVTKEQEWMNKYKVTHRLFNSVPTAGNSLGYKHTEETKMKMKRIKDVEVYNIKGEHIGKYNSIDEAITNLNITDRSAHVRIWKCITGIDGCRLYKSMHFKSAKVNRREDHKSRIIPVRLTNSETGDTLFFISMRACGDYFGTSSNPVSAALNNKTLLNGYKVENAIF